MTIHIFGGGTVQHVRNHMALCTPAYGSTARQLFELAGDSAAKLHLTRMADYRSTMETNEDVEVRLQAVLADADAHALIFNVALCDYSGEIGDIKSGKYAQRLSSREGAQAMRLTPTPKLLALVKAARPDMTVVGFKTTADATVFTQLSLARRQMGETGVDIVLANDTVTRANLLVSATKAVDGPRDELLLRLIQRLRRPQ